MINIKNPVVLGVVASLALGIFAAVPAAHADPVSDSYVAVGSDTLDSSMNALTNGTLATGSAVRITAGSANLASYDAFGSATIQTTSGGPYFIRPQGSGEGVKALTASIKGTNYGTTTANSVNVSGQVDIARSSSGPGSNANTAGKLVYVPYARDAVSYAYYGDSAALGNLTTAQLNSLYTNGATTINGVLVTPLIPQASSGTRKFFLSAIGVSSDASCTLSICTSSTLAENDASVLTANTIIPFSAANWIAQSNGVAQSTITANVKLGSPNGVAPYTGTTTLVASDVFYNGTRNPDNSIKVASIYGRDTYLVVEYARVDSASATYDATLAGLVDSTVATSLTNFGTAPSQPGAVKKKFGFLAPSTTTPTRAYTW